MPKPDIIYDSDREVAALIDTDSMRALGPIMVGPGAGEMLNEFVNRMPEAVFEASSYDLTAYWGSYFAENFAPLSAAPAATDPGTVGVDDNASDDEPIIATTVNGAPSDEPPGEQSADTDMEADTSPAGTVTDCPACSGRGMITVADDEAPARCNMCQGSGKILQHA